MTGWEDDAIHRVKLDCNVQNDGSVETQCGDEHSENRPCRNEVRKLNKL